MIEGKMTLFTDLKLSVKDIEKWEPLRFRAFWTGLALAFGAGSGKSVHEVIEGLNNLPTQEIQISIVAQTDAVRLLERGA